MKSGYPVYDHPPTKVSAGLVARRDWAQFFDAVCMVVSGILSIVLALYLVFVSFTSWTHALYLVLMWAVLSYLALPRFHQIMTVLYVPNYYIGRARTGDGLLGDPVNLALMGSAEQIHAVMQQAGWVKADEITAASSWRIVRSSLTKSSYPQAPVSDLFLFDRRHDFAYQQEVEGNPAQRHHVRFWRTPPGWLLPGGHRVDWLAAATYDRAVGLSLFTLQFTHKIDENVDIERDYLIETMRYGSPSLQVTGIADFSTSYHARNGGGDLIITDGSLPIVHAGLPLTLEQATALDEPHPVRQGAPLSLFLTAFLIGLAVVAQGLLLAVYFLVDLAELAGVIPELGQYDWAVEGGAAAITLLQVLLLVGVFRGYQRARVGLLVLLTLSVTFEVVQVVSFGRTAEFMDIGLTLLSLLAAWTLSSRRLRAWVGQRSAWRHRFDRPGQGLLARKIKPFAG